MAEFYTRKPANKQGHKDTRDGSSSGGGGDLIDV